MSLQPPVAPDDARIAASTLTNEELAFLVAAFDALAERQVPVPTGWSLKTENRICTSIREAAKIRGIKNGVLVVTQTIELRS